MIEHQGPPPDPELPKDKCPKGCEGYTEYPISVGPYDTRCLKCGELWQQGTSPNRR